MAGVETAAAYSAFETQLRTLCLQEFPCGAGPWRENHKKKVKSLTACDKVDEKFSVTLKDYGSQYEKTEELDDYITMKKSPWKLDYSWSNEAKSLREIAVRSPWLIDQKFILNYFKTIKINDKNVEDVDARLLQFENLEELTLSANKITYVNSKNLPQSLKVLELCANQVSDISGLCVRPLPLIHLGLGYNSVSSVGDYLTGDYWPQLLSLDLSENNLSDLLDIIRKLGTLPKLRNLVLQGNPLSLVPGYRGYTIDSLRKLNLLDDVRITADERHHFKGLARRREFILDEAKVFLEVHFVKGIPMPEELKNPDDQPEYPIIEKKYCVEWMYLEDSSSKADVFHIEDAQGDNSPHPESDFPCEVHHQAEEQEQVSHTNPESDDSAEVPKVVLFAEKTEVAPTPDKTASVTVGESHMTDVVSEAPSPGEGSQQGEITKIAVAPVKTQLLPWEEDLEFNWSTGVVRDDLVSLRNFFKQGMELRIVEEKVLLNLAEPRADTSCSSPSSKKGKDGKVEKNAGKGDKKKDDKGKDGKGGKDGKKKKKGEPDEELVRSPPEVSTVATFHVSLMEFLEGEFELEYQFSKMLGDGTEIAASSKVEAKKKDGKKDTKKKEEGKAKDKGLPKSAKGKEQDKKDTKGKGKAAAATDEEGDEPSPPPPLEISVAIRLHHWKTAYDSVKEEEERNKVLADKELAVEGS